MDARHDHLHSLTVVLQHPRFLGLLATVDQVFLVGAVAEGVGAGVVERVDDFALELVGAAVGVDLFFEQADPGIVVAALVAEQVFVFLHLGHVVVLLTAELVLELVEHAVQVVLARSVRLLLRIGLQCLLKLIDV